MCQRVIKRPKCIGGSTTDLSMSEDRGLTGLNDASVLHPNDDVGHSQKARVVGAEDARLVTQQSHNAPVKEVLSDVGVDGRQRVVKQVDVLVLSPHQHGSQPRTAWTTQDFFDFISFFSDFFSIFLIC